MAEEQNQEVVGGVHQNKLMAVLAYIGPLVIVSFLVAKNDPFVKFHIKQGLVLFVFQLIIWFLGMNTLYFMYNVTQLINIAIWVLAIIGVFNVVQGKEKALPIVGSLAKYFNF